MLWIKISLVELLLLYVLLLYKCFRVFIGFFYLNCWKYHEIVLNKELVYVEWGKRERQWDRDENVFWELSLKSCWDFVFNCNAFPSTTYFYLLIEILTPMWFNTKQLRKHALLRLYKNMKTKPNIIIALELIFLHFNAFWSSGHSNQIMMVVSIPVFVFLVKEHFKNIMWN